MQVHVIGHASLLIRTTDRVILMDPVLWDPHQEGLFDVYPKREVIHNLLPKCSVIVLSHRHLDHFDIRSLATLPRDAVVFIPKDALIERYLQKLGYARIQPLNEFSEVTLGRTRLFTTRSENRVPEFGVVFADESGTVWNQVDTVVSPNTAEKVRSLFSHIDLLIAAWQPMLEDNFQMNGSLSFPYDRYGQMLYSIGLIAPRALVPGSNGFCYTGVSSWLNRVVFPISRERFLLDAKVAAPSAGENVHAVDPGDIIEIKDGAFSVQSRGCEFVRRLGNGRDILEFSPVTTDGTLVDHNPDGVVEGEMEAAIVDMIENGLGEVFEQHRPRFAEMERWGVVYQLEVVLPRTRLRWFVDFSQPRLEIVRGKSGLANCFTYITGSALYGLIARTRGWDYSILGGHYRQFRTLCRATPLSVVRPEGTIGIDPLHLLFPYEEILNTVLDREVEKWSQNAAVTAGL